MVANSYITNHNLTQTQIVDLLVTGFTGMLHSWWEKHLTETSRNEIKNAVKKDEDGIPIFDEQIGQGVPDAINTLLFTIIEHFIGTPSNVTSRIHDQLSNLRCPTLSDFRWYKDVFMSRVMLREDSNQPFWKEKFINGLPNLFAHKIRNVLVNEEGIIPYHTLTYGNIINIIQKEGLKMCIDMKISKQVNKDKAIAKYELGTFCEQYGLPPIAPSNKKKKNPRSIISTPTSTQVGNTPSIINTNLKIKTLKLISFTKNPNPTSGNGNLPVNSTPKTQNKKEIATSVASMAITPTNVVSRKPLIS